MSKPTFEPHSLARTAQELTFKDSDPPRTLPADTLVTVIKPDTWGDAYLIELHQSQDGGGKFWVNAHDLKQKDKP